jgi:hypothetical protein
VRTNGLAVSKVAGIMNKAPDGSEPTHRVARRGHLAVLGVGLPIDLVLRSDGVLQCNIWGGGEIGVIARPHPP